MTSITKAYAGVPALTGANLVVAPGEIHALMGENGAGKSTLIKALTGVYSIDSGSISVHGTDVAFSGPGQAEQAGIATVYQEVNLVTNLTVAENIMLGREPRRLGMIDFRRMRRHAATVLHGLNLDVDPERSMLLALAAVQEEFYDQLDANGEGGARVRLALILAPVDATGAIGPPCYWAIINGMRPAHR